MGWVFLLTIFSPGTIVELRDLTTPQVLTMKSIKVRAIDIKRAIALITSEQGHIPTSMLGKAGTLLGKARSYMIGMLQLPIDATDLELLRAMVQFYCGFSSHGAVDRVSMYLRCLHEDRDVAIADCDERDLQMIMTLVPSLKIPHQDEHPEDEGTSDDGGECGIDAVEASSTRETMISKLGGLPTLDEMRPLIQSQIDAMGLTGQITVEEFSDIWA